MYQLGFDFQAVPPTLASNRSGFGAPCVAKTSFFSFSGKSPAKESMPSGSNQIRPLDVDVRKDIRLWEIRLLCLRCLVGVRSERSDVYQPRDTVVSSGAGDDASAVGMANKDNRTADPTDCCFRYCDVFCR